MLKRVRDVRPAIWLLIVAGVCLLAWAMFVVHLDFESMWSDEWFSWRYAAEGPLALVRDTANDVHPPFYYLLLSGWISLTGSQSLFVMRLGTAVFPALLAVALTYRLALEWFKNRWAGLGAAAFLATCGIFVYYARELRMYALTVLLVVMSWWFLTRYLHGRRRALLGYAACVGLMAYTYYFSAFALFAQLIIVLWFYRDKFLGLLRAYVGVFVAFIPWIPTLLSQIYYERARTGNPDAAIIGKFGATAPTNLTNIGVFIDTYTAREPAYVLLLIVLALGLSWRISRSLRALRWVIAAALWLFLSIVLMFGLNLAFPIYNQRYLLPVVPGLALLAGVAVARVTARITVSPGRLSAGLVGVIAVCGIVFHTDAFLPEKTPHKDMLRAIAAEYRPGDRIWYNFSYGGLGSSLTEEVAYHLEFDAPSLNTDEFVWDAPHDYADTTKVPRVWDVRPYWIPIPDEAAAPLTAGRVLAEAYTFGAYTVRLYAAPPVGVSPVRVGDEFTMLPSGAQKPEYHPGDTVTVETWWKTSSLPTLDYSYVLLLGNPGDPLVKQDDGLVAETLPTSQWTPDSYRLSQITFTLPDDIPAGEYSVRLGVYYWQDQKLLPVVTTDSPDPLRVATVVGTVNVG